MARQLLMTLVIAVLAGTGAAWGSETVSTTGGKSYDREDPFTVREYMFPRVNGDIALGVAYGPHRDGQRPGGPGPSRAEIVEDLRLMAPYWSVLRVYGSSGFAKTMLEAIREEKLAFTVMLGVWIAPEETRDEEGNVTERFPEVRADNRREMEAAVKLAEEYPGIVTSICVGNETQVFWSAHRSPVDILIDYIREMRARTTLPVTTADDFNYWNKPESAEVAHEVDFIAAHMHPLWNGILLADALDWTQKTYASLQAEHPERKIVIAETGWATDHYDGGEQGKLIKGRTGEAEQAVFYGELRRWVREDEVPVFVFEAFDENWKGGDHVDEVEKHWGLYRADRTPKPALLEDARRDGTGEK